ncbi:hypothetical protein CsSME_00033343 [Camellia sinensis var. sinensis]
MYIHVVKMLKGEIKGSSEREKKFQRRPVLKRTFSVGVYDAEDHSTSKYLNGNQPMQMALQL